MDWLEWIFQGVGLFESGVWFIGGLIMCLVGIILGWEGIAYRLRAYRVPVRILGVLPNTTNKKIRRAFHPIYEFTTRDGEEITMKSQAASSLAGNLPHTERTFLVDPENKYDLRSTKPWQILVGLFCFACGLGLFKIASVTGRSLLWAGVVALVIILSWVTYTFLRPEEPQTTETPQPRPKPSRPSRIVSAVVKKPEKFDPAKILSEREHWEEMMRADRSMLLWMPLWLGLAIAALGFGGYRGYQRVSLTLGGESTIGKVVRIESSDSTDSVSYYSIARFEDAHGQSHEVRDIIGSSSPMDDRGDELAVVYDPANPERALIDRGIWSWLLPAGLSLIGLIVVYAYGGFLINYFKRRKLGQEILAGKAGAG